jgi:tRNA modification GTPase
LFSHLWNNQIGQIPQSTNSHLNKQDYQPSVRVSESVTNVYDNKISDFHIVPGDLESLALAAEAEQAIIVVNKCDSTRSEALTSLLEGTEDRLKTLFPGKPPPMVSISCQDAETSGGNINHLLDILQTTFGTMTSVGDDLDLLGVSERQSQLLSACTDHLEQFKDEALQGEECDIVVAAEHLRAAAVCLARITGRGEAGDVEEVLGVVFEKCGPLQCPRFLEHC